MLELSVEHMSICNWYLIAHTCGSHMINMIIYLVSDGHLINTNVNIQTELQVICDIHMTNKVLCTCDSHMIDKIIM